MFTLPEPEFDNLVKIYDAIAFLKCYHTELVMLWKLDRPRDLLLDGLTSKLHSSFLSLAELTLNSVLAKDLRLCYSEGVSRFAPLENVEGFLQLAVEQKWDLVWQYWSLVLSVQAFIHIATVFFL